MPFESAVVAAAPEKYETPLLAVVVPRGNALAGAGVNWGAFGVAVVRRRGDGNFSVENRPDGCRSILAASPWQRGWSWQWQGLSHSGNCG